MVLGRFHFVLQQLERGRRRYGPAPDSLSQHFRIRCSRVGEVVRPPGCVSPLPETSEGRHAIVDDPEPTPEECAVVVEYVPRERDTRRQVIQIVLAIAFVEIWLE